MRKLITIFVTGIAGVLLFVPTFSFAQTNLTNRLAGKILLQVESRGEAWYVHPDTKKRHSLGRPADAFKIMREVSMGISNADLTRLFGALPTGSQEIYSASNKTLANRLSGQILLQVESSGEAYYINPDNLKGYYLARPADAFRIMQELGLGITNTDLEDIPIASEIKAAETITAKARDYPEEEQEKSSSFLYLAEKIGQDDALVLAQRLNDFDTIMTKEFIDNFVIDYSPAYDVDNDLTIIGDPEAPHFLEIAKNSLKSLYNYSPDLYQYALKEFRYLRGINFGTRCGAARTGGPWMEVNTYIWRYDYEGVPLNEQPLVYGFLFIHEATHDKNHALEGSGQIRKLVGYEDESIAYLAHSYYAKEYDYEGQGVLNPGLDMTLKEFVKRWTFRCEPEPEGYIWDWDFYVIVLEKAGFPPRELEKLKAYLDITSTAPVISNIQISKTLKIAAPDSVTITWDTDKPATSTVEYSLNSDLSSATTITENVFRTSHIHNDYLTNLIQGKTYYYRITVTDVSGNSIVSSIHQFVKQLPFLLFDPTRTRLLGGFLFKIKR